MPKLDQQRRRAGYACLCIAIHKQRKESSTTGSFPVAQFDSSQKPYVTFGNVPKAVCGEFR